MEALPEYINYLLAPDTPLDFAVNIGDPETTTPVKFRVVKWMLIARSKVLRAMLLESKLRHDGEFNIADMDPVTFKNFLVFLYGYDNTSSLSFEDAVKLLSAAEKYDVPDLKKPLGEVISSKVTLENLFVVLQHGLVCEKIPKLWTKVTKLIQCHTEDVFSHTDFLTASPEAVVHIVQQDCLSVPEIDIWRAALKWATHRVNHLEGATSPGSLRSTMQPLLQHIRLCTLSEKKLCREVFPAQVLTQEELIQICLFLGKQEPPNNLLQICNITKKRGCVSDCKVKTFKTRRNVSDYKLKESKLYLLTKASDIELTGLVCQANDGPPAQTYLCECKVKITRMTDSRNDSSTEPPVEISFSDRVEYGADFTIPLREVLKAGSKYAIEFEFTVGHTMFYRGNPAIPPVSDDFEITSTVNGPYNYYKDHLKALHYRVKASG